jgi:hypothetical protein
MNNILSWLESRITVTEQDVVALVVKVKQGIALAAHEINAGLGWIANETPNIAADIQQAASLVQLAGVVDPAAEPEVVAAVAAANTAVAGLNAFATAYKSGTGTAQSVVAGYTAIKAAQSAAANAAAIAASAPVTPAPVAAVPTVAASTSAAA